MCFLYNCYPIPETALIFKFATCRPSVFLVKRSMEPKMNIEHCGMIFTGETEVLTESPV